MYLSIHFIIKLGDFRADARPLGIHLKLYKKIKENRRRKRRRERKRNESQMSLPGGSGTIDSFGALMNWGSG